MFSPSYFAVDDPETIRKFVRRHSFGTLVTEVDGDLDVNHVPFVLRDEPAPHGCLHGHVARLNPLVARPGDAGWRAVAILDGPHGYVSPSWYPSTAKHGRNVPTWNYVTAHLHGHLRLVDDRDFVMTTLESLAAQYESGYPRPWTMGSAPAGYIDRLAAAIVGIELTVTHIECQWKLSQNKNAADFAGVVAGLRAAHDDALADYMQRVAPPA